MKKSRYTVLNLAAMLPLTRCIGLVVALALSACASLAPDITIGGTVNIERINSHNARVALVRARAMDHKLRISGSLMKQYSGRGAIPGFLQIEVLGDDGILLGQTTSHYIQHGAKSRRAYFAEIVTVRPADVRTIRVIHQGPGLENC
jgi:hypothetical protein